MKYSSEHHNWDMTVMASSRLVTLGENIEKNDYSFSAFTGSMLLAVAGLESFLNSIAHTLSINDSEFPYIEFDRKGIVEKLDFLLDKFSISLNKGERPYQTIKKAVTWRNSVVHSKPFYVEETMIEPRQDIRKLPKQYKSNDNKYPPYENLVSKENADRFNRDIIKIIESIKSISGLNPRAQCSYTIT
ncbi:hypothetical protein [Thiomicrorhabdus lithotrophica]|uniref:Cthe-2314-like HEPN domain-containing protein n=1 Tax=Thiomicrorhabdus lithotrophica TaxID=2949997 RepID=A0ABY8C787_9GAMM|nr:hypothetical protein [Thiomicrorhabdus lithotrophica]WEJ61824.1 hypothetical protein NR989_07325 [Thiomicrorhabdus lithotrophica]